MRVLTICGSLQESSSNAALLRAVVSLVPDTLEVMSARVVATLGVGGVSNKRDAHGDIVDPETLEKIATTLIRLRDAINDAP